MPADQQQSEEQSAEYQAFLAAGELRMQRCDHCGTVRHPPRWICPECLGTDWTWQPLLGTGRVETFVWYFESLDPRFTELPYNVAVVRLEEGVRVVTNVLHVAFGELSVGQRVRAKITPGRQGKSLLCFTADAGDAEGSVAEPGRRPPTT